MSDAKSVISNLVASITEENNNVTLEGYEVHLISECEAGCGTEFDSPVIALMDKSTRSKTLITCGDATCDEDEDEPSIEDEIE